MISGSLCAPWERGGSRIESRWRVTLVGATNTLFSLKEDNQTQAQTKKKLMETETPGPDDSRGHHAPFVTAVATSLTPKSKNETSERNDSEARGQNSPASRD